MAIPSVIIVPAHSSVALAVIRSLGRHSVPVTALTTGDGSAHVSRYCDRVIRTPKTQICETLLELVKAQPGCAVIGLGDRDIPKLNRIREQLEKYAILLFPDQERFALALNKDRTLRLAREAGVPVPATYTVQELEGLTELPRFPVVIKPREKGPLPFQVVYAHTPEELDRQMERLKQWRDLLLVQEYVPGYGVGVNMLMRNGRTLMAFQHRRIREYPPSGGVGVCVESEAVSPVLLRHSEALLKAMHWDGVAMVEYRVDPESGRMALMEVNGRFWGSLPLAVHAGADFPAALVESHEAAPAVKRTGYRCSLRCRSLAPDTKWLWSVLRMRSVPALEAIGSYLRDFRPGTTYFTWSWDDPLPALHVLGRRFRLAAEFVQNAIRRPEGA